MRLPPCLPPAKAGLRGGRYKIFVSPPTRSQVISTGGWGIPEISRGKNRAVLAIGYGRTSGDEDACRNLRGPHGLSFLRFLLILL
jgi:hypothetical protein